MNRTINIIYFSWVRERLGFGEEQISFGDEVQTIADILGLLSGKGPAYAEILSELEKLRFALDQDFKTPTSLIGSAKELAIFPPVTGG